MRPRGREAAHTEALDERVHRVTPSVSQFIVAITCVTLVANESYIDNTSYGRTVGLAPFFRLAKSFSTTSDTSVARKFTAITSSADLGRAPAFPTHPLKACSKPISRRERNAASVGSGREVWRGF